MQLVGRTTSREVTLHGVTIPAGGRVVLVYGAANRDERRFADPDRFDVRRGRFRHLGFGEGMHGCLGAPLARLEAKVALEEGLPALGDYTIAAPPERYRTTPNMYVWDHLHLAFPVAAAPEHHAHVETVRRDSTSMTVLTREFEADVRVEGKDEVADGVVALTLRQIADSPLPRWSPGAHVDLILDGVPTRQYSLCGDPADHHLWRLGILRDAGRRRRVARSSTTGCERATRCGSADRGTTSRWLPSPRYLFIAGGIGITPILPMIAAASAAGRRLAAALRRALPARRWRSSPSWPRTATASPWRRRTRPGCSTSTRCWARRSRTRWSTAAGPSRCWPRSRRAARPGRPGRCTWSGSPPGR